MVAAHETLDMSGGAKPKALGCPKAAVEAVVAGRNVRQDDRTKVAAKDDPPSTIAWREPARQLQRGFEQRSAGGMLAQVDKPL